MALPMVALPVAVKQSGQDFPADGSKYRELPGDLSISSVHKAPPPGIPHKPRYNKHFFFFSQRRYSKVNSRSGAAEVSRSTVVAVVAGTTVAQVASIMGIAIFPVIAPALAVEMGVRPAWVGYQVSLVYGSAMVAAPVMSPMITRWGACRATQVGLVFCVIAMVFGLTSSLWGLIVTSILIGMALSVMVPASAHLLFRFSPPRNRNVIFSLKQTGVPLAWTLAGVTAPAMTLAFGWQWPLVTVLAMALVMLFALQGAREAWDDDRDAHAASRQRLFEGLVLAWRHPVLRWLTITSMCLSFVQLCLGTFAVTMLVEEAGYNLVTAGLMLSLVQASAVAGRILWGWIADRIGDSLGVLQKLTICMIGCCLSTAFLSPAWPVAITGILFVIFGATAVGWNGFFLAEIARCSPRGQVSVATSGAMVWNFAGILTGPALFATAYQIIGSYALTFGLLALVPAVGLALEMLARNAARREESSGR